jgi:hypothetical protein
MPSDLPSFASQWVQQWKNAAPRLQAIRDEELRRLEPGMKEVVAGQLIYDKYPERHGMVIMQRWFTRRHLMSESTRSESTPRKSPLSEG